MAPRAGTLAGSGVIAGSAAQAATTALGVALILYGIVGLAKPRLRVPPGAFFRPLRGAIHM